MIFHLANAEVYEECPITNAVLSQQNMFIYIKQHVDLRLFKRNVCSHNTILYNEVALSSSICANNYLNKLLHFNHQSSCLEMDLIICYRILFIRMISHNILEILIHRFSEIYTNKISMNITLVVSTYIQLMLMYYSHTKIGHQNYFTETQEIDNA